MGGEPTEGAAFGVRIEKTVYPSGDPYPMVAYVLENDWSAPVAVRFTDTVPSEIRPADVGFRESDHDDWTVGDDGTIAYETTIAEDAKDRTVALLRQEPFPTDAVRDSEPTVTAVQRLDQAGAPDRGVEDRRDDRTDEERQNGAAGTGDTSRGPSGSDGDEADADNGSTGGSRRANGGRSATGGQADAAPQDQEGQTEEIELDDPSTLDEHRADAADGETRGTHPQAERTEAGSGATALDGGDATVGGTIDAETIRIDVTAEEAAVAKDGDRTPESDRSPFEPDRLARLERRLDDIQQALVRRESQSLPGAATSNGSRPDDELVELLEAFTTSAERLADTLDDIHEYVADAPGSGGGSMPAQDGHTPGGAVDGQRSPARPTGRPPQSRDRRTVREADGDNGLEIGVPTRTGPASRTADVEAEWNGIGAGDDEARVVVFDATNGHDQPNGTAPGEANRVDTTVDVRDFAMDDDEFTFDELIALGSDILSSIAESTSADFR